MEIKFKKWDEHDQPADTYLASCKSILAILETVQEAKKVKTQKEVKIKM